MVVSTYNFTVTYPTTGNFMIIFLKFDANRLAFTGQIAYTGDAKLNYILDRIAQNPGGYITATLSTMKFNPGATGSGAFITPKVMWSAMPTR